MRAFLSLVLILVSFSAISAFFYFLFCERKESKRKIKLLGTFLSHSTTGLGRTSVRVQLMASTWVSLRSNSVKEEKLKRSKENHPIYILEFQFKWEFKVLSKNHWSHLWDIFRQNPSSLNCIIWHSFCLFSYSRLY